MLTYKQNNFNQNNQSNQISDRSIFQQTSQQKQTDWQQKTYNWNYQQIIMTEIQELSERLVNHKEIVKQISKYDKLIEIKEEGAEVKEFLESLTEEKRKELFPTVDEFLRNMQNQNPKDIENEMANCEVEEEDDGEMEETSEIEAEIETEIREGEENEQFVKDDFDLIENIKFEAKEFRPGFEGRPLPKLIRMIESGKTFNLSKKIKRKLGTDDDRKINKQIRKYVESYRFQPSPMLDG
ncbi:hypothetical protein Glove_303g81 [Diversispora epigaea]|uniref:Uncharacterized protein n=1 Tax=Diversispora epigaea TaxID=1348612 RepID=A0A397HUU6_9GLOM|nr:hypothetical protein Glove_303g81 [Diversispora epigaea]